MNDVEQKFEVFARLMYIAVVAVAGGAITFLACLTVWGLPLQECREDVADLQAVVGEPIDLGKLGIRVETIEAPK